MLALAIMSGMLAHAFAPPHSIHEWRQRDALSQTLRYLEDDRGFFEPAMHFQHAEGGQGAGEFTGLYYMNVWVWKLVGRPLHWTLRWTQGLALFLGLLALVLAVRNWTGSVPLGAWSAVAVFVSPLVQFYGVNYLVNPTSLMAVFGAWWMGSMSERHGNRSKVWLIGASLLLAFAGLLRPTMLLGAIPLISRWFKTRHVPVIWGLFAGLLALTAVGAWIVWAKAYNLQHQSPYFLTDLRPIWNAPDVRGIWSDLIGVRFQEIYHAHIRWVFAFILLATFFRSWKKREGLAIPFGLTCLGMVVYGLLWFKNLDVHDYYLIEVLMLPPLAMAWVFHVWKQAQVPKAVWGILLLVLAYQMAHSVARNRIKWGQTDGFLIERFIPEWERREWKWYHADRAERLAPLPAFSERMLEWGIPEDAWVLSLPDPSPNVTLTLLNRLGFTGLYENHLEGKDRVAWAVSRGADYLVINRSDITEVGDWGDWLAVPLGELEGIVVYDLQAAQRIQPENER